MSRFASCKPTGIVDAIEAAGGSSPAQLHSSRGRHRSERFHYFCIPLRRHGKKVAAGKPRGRSGHWTGGGTGEESSLHWESREPCIVDNDRLFVGFSEPQLYQIAGYGSDSNPPTIQWFCREGIVADSNAISLARAIRKEMETGGIATHDCVRALLTLLGVHIVRTYANLKLAGARPGQCFDGLSVRGADTIGAYIREHIAEHLDLEHLARFAGLSASHLSRVFLRQFGTSPHRYIVKFRLDRAWSLSAYSTLSFKAIARMVGFSTSSHMTATMRRNLGVTPSQVRCGQARARRQPPDDRAEPAKIRPRNRQITVSFHVQGGQGGLMGCVCGRRAETTAPWGACGSGAARGSRVSRPSWASAVG